MDVTLPYLYCPKCSKATYVKQDKSTLEWVLDCDECKIICLIDLTNKIE